MAHFNRLSPDGAHIVGQRITNGVNEIELDGQVIGWGHSPQWLTSEKVIWAEDGGTHLFVYGFDLPFRPVIDIGRETNLLQANGGDSYIAEHRSHPFGYTHNGRFYPSDITPKLLPDGSLAWESLIWQQSIVPVPGSVPWIVRQQPWQSASGDTRLVAHPQGSDIGYVLAVGDTLYPDAAWWGTAKRLRVVWTKRSGATGETALTLTEPRVDLGLPQDPPVPSPSFKPPKVNVVAYASTIQPATPAVLAEWLEEGNKQHCKVWIDEKQSIRVSHTIGGKTDTTGKQRTVQVVCPDGGDEPPEEPPDTHPREWRGNFLANGLEPWSFMYPGWDAARCARFRGHYRRLGMTHLPIGIWGKYRDEPAFDYRQSQGEYRVLLREMRADGIVPCVMVITDELDGVARSADYSIGWAEEWLPGIADLVDLVCLGWELNQVAGWTEKGQNGNKRQGHDMIRLAKVVRRAIPKARVYLHLQPNWWGPHYEDGDEATWWRHVEDNCHGLLMQVEPTEPIPQALHYCYELPSPHGWPPGVCGRLGALGKDFVLFESARTPERHAQIVGSIPPGRGHGFC